MKFVEHGSKSHGRGWRSTCGQACVAMIAEVSLEKACTAVGKQGATTFADIRRGLHQLGYTVTGCRLIKDHPIPDGATAILRVRAGSSTSPR
jgi:hypothetical protein